MTARKQPDLKVTWETWTVEDAENALKHNECNRPLGLAVVDQYCRDMLAREWTNDGSPIRFNVHGQLIDGQHRLHAQIKAGLTMRWLVIRDVEVKANLNIDMNKRRRLSDLLGYAGESDPQLLVAIIRLVWNIRANKLSRGRYAVSAAEMNQLLEDHPDVRFSAEIAAWCKRRSMTPIAPSILGAAHWMIMQKVGRENADLFVARVTTLIGEEEGSPILALNSRMNQIKGNGQRINQRDQLNFAIKTWNYDAVGKLVNSMTLYPKNQKAHDWKLFEVKDRKVPQKGLTEDDEGEDEETSAAS